MPCVLLILQFVNLALFVLQIYYHFITNIWIIFVVILFEGLLGGAAYVNSFYQISKKVTSSHAFTLLLSSEKVKHISGVSWRRHDIFTERYFGDFSLVYRD